MAGRKKDLPEIVQQQISESTRNLGKVLEGHPRGFFANTTDPVIYDTNPNIVWYKKYYTEDQTRCRNFNPLVSGFSRGIDYGWCLLSLSSELGNLVDDAKYHWQRTGGCSVGKYTTCSGYIQSKYYTPHWKQFRGTTTDVLTGRVVSNEGEIIEQFVTSGFTSMYSTEIYREYDGPVKFNISTADNITIFASGHLKFTSGTTPNSATEAIINIPGQQWVRIDATYYSGYPNGRLSFGRQLNQYIDAWREVTVPSGVQAHYATFSRKDPNSIGVWSHMLAHITTENNTDITGIDIDWRAPDIIPQWHRIHLPLSASEIGIQVSGIWRVPPNEEIEVRARAVNQWADYSQWHPTSGILSAQGNVKPGLAPEPLAIRGFEVNPGLSRFEFNLIPSNVHDWRDYILISGGDHDHYVESNVVTVAASRGSRFIETAGGALTASGMLIAINGGYQTDTTGELHIVDDVVGSTIYLREPLLNDIAISNPWKSYHVAKITADTNFSLFCNNTETWYFNICARNFSNGISPLAENISSWKDATLTITATEGLLEDESSLIGRNYFVNGSFELPRYSEALSSDYIAGVPDDYPYGVSFSQIPHPVNRWYSCSGYGTKLDFNFSRTGRQGVLLQGGAFYDYGIHAGLHQDINGTLWNKRYYCKGYISRNDYTSLNYKNSGVFGIYHELWGIEKGLIAGRDYTYGTIPASAAFISSGNSWVKIDADQTWILVSGFLDNKITHIVETDNSYVAPDTYDPFIRISIFYAPETYGLWADFGGIGSANTFSNAAPFTLDDVFFSRLDRRENIYDDSLDFKRFDFGDMRLNEQAHTLDGDHLDVDEKFGFIVRRRNDNPKPVNRQAPSSLDIYATSGWQDIPRLTYWWPLAAPSVASPTGPQHSTNNSLLNNGFIVVPSGRAAVFEITPVRTFWASSDEELTAGTSNNPVRKAIPSGGSYIIDTWYDPGVHGLAQILDVYYIKEDYSTGWISQNPLVATWDDIRLIALQLDARTVMTIPQNGVATTNIKNVYWHACDVKMYEIAAPFISSGISPAGDTVGANVVEKLAQMDEVQSKTVGFRSA